jgi:hypothetical protein
MHQNSEFFPIWRYVARAVRTQTFDIIRCSHFHDVNVCNRLDHSLSWLMCSCGFQYAFLFCTVRNDSLISFDTKCLLRLINFISFFFICFSPFLRALHFTVLLSYIFSVLFLYSILCSLPSYLSFPISFFPSFICSFFHLFILLLRSNPLLSTINFIKLSLCFFLL